MHEPPFNWDSLRRWFFLNRRQLPWRENSSPYAVWVSEVMLQQTQVAVVIPYFERWMRLFPTVEALALAEREDVIKAWEGLGYYSRARNLHDGARYLLENHGGELPETAELLSKVKGVGPYTVGAIRSFAFKQKAAAVDGNVLRVMTRYFGIEEAVDQGKTRKAIEERVMALLPEFEPWVVMEALIELGALVCQKKADCQSCPLKTSCLAFQQDKVAELPRKGKKIPTTLLHRLVAIIQSKQGFLLKQGEQGQVMADLWEFPYFEHFEPVTDIQTWQETVESHFSLSLSYKKALPEVSHGFTRYRAFLYPHIWQTEDVTAVDGYEWVELRDLKKIPFSSGHRRLLTFLL